MSKNKVEENEEVEQDEPAKLYTIVACVYMSRYLIAGDPDGLSDPYTQIIIEDKKQYTTIKERCSNGVWNEKLVFNGVSFKYNNKATWPIMEITVLDKDKKGSEILGYSYIWLSDSNYEVNSAKRIAPKWQQLFLHNSNREQG